MVLVGGCCGGAWPLLWGVPAGWEGVLAKEWEVFPAGTPLRLMVFGGGDVVVVRAATTGVPAGCEGVL